VSYEMGGVRTVRRAGGVLDGTDRGIRKREAPFSDDPGRIRCAGLEPHHRASRGRPADDEVETYDGVADQCFIVARLTHDDVLEPQDFGRTIFVNTGDSRGGWHDISV
jgi:hypothetical protein